MDREEFERQLEQWLGFMREEALALFVKGVGPQNLMGLASKIADARLTIDVQRRQELALLRPFAAQDPTRHS
jgi:hypothetical protein